MTRSRMTARSGGSRRRACRLRSPVPGGRPPRWPPAEPESEHLHALARTRGEIASSPRRARPKSEAGCLCSASSSAVSPRAAAAPAAGTRAARAARATRWCSPASISPAPARSRSLVGERTFVARAEYGLQHVREVVPEPVAAPEPEPEPAPSPVMAMPGGWHVFPEPAPDPSEIAVVRRPIADGDGAVVGYELVVDGKGAAATAGLLLDAFGDIGLERLTGPPSRVAPDDGGVPARGRHAARAARARRAPDRGRARVRRAAGRARGA